MNINKLTKIQSALSYNSNLFNSHPPKMNTPVFENMVELESILSVIPDILILDDNIFNVYSLRLLIEEIKDSSYKKFFKRDNINLEKHSICLVISRIRQRKHSRLLKIAL